LHNYFLKNEAAASIVFAATQNHLHPALNGAPEFSFSNAAGGKWPFAGADTIWVRSAHLGAK